MSSLLWGIVPGLGQIHFGCAKKGLLLFALFTFSLNACLVLPLIVGDRIVHSSLISLTILFWLISFVDNFSASAEWELSKKPE